MKDVSAASERQVIQVIQGVASEKEDLIAVEYPLTMELNGKEFVTMLCTPDDLEELVTGFLFSEGLVDSAAEIIDQRFIATEQRVIVTTSRPGALGEKLFGKRTVTTGCGRGTIFYHVNDAMKSKPVLAEALVEPETIYQVMRHWEERTDLFRTTGCPHSAALASIDGEVLAVREDIGRHNAVDKIIGRALLSGWSLSDKMLLTTGRISSEMLIKVAKAGMPYVVSRSAPTELALSFGDALGVTVIGFVRGRRLNVYTHSRRVVLNFEGGTP